MRILMIAPEPFFEPRGTPFSEFHRIRALTQLGHQVDLVTYPIGQDVTMPGLRVVRSLRPPFVRHVKIGPSLAKIPLDALLTLTAFRMAFTQKYDAIHSHEEGGIIGVVLSALLGVPHLYDMHSSLPQQLTNFNFTGSTLARGIFRFFETLMIRRSRVVIVICPALEDTVRATDPSAQVVLIENAPGSADDPATQADADAVRATFGLHATTPLVLYTGTFEAYQGLDLLFASMAFITQARPDARLLLAGGKPDQVAKARAQAIAASMAVSMHGDGVLPIWPSWLWAGFAVSAAVAVPAMWAPELIAKALKPLTFLHPEWVGKQIQQLTDTLIRFREKPSSLITCFGGAIVVQALVVGFYLTVVYALNIPVTASDLAVIVPLSLIVQMLPLSVNGFGVREATFSFYFTRVGLPIESAVLLSLVAAALTMIHSLSGAAVYVTRKR